MTSLQNAQLQNLVLRPVSPDDAAQLRALYQLSLARNTEGFVQKPDYHGDIAARAEKYVSENGAMLGLFTADNELLGFGGLKSTTPGRVELCNLHLHPQYQGQGLGKRLTLALMDEAQELGYQTVELHVTVTQTAAIGLYKRLGFVETRRQVYHVEGQTFDTLFMEYVF